MICIPLPCAENRRSSNLPASRSEPKNPSQSSSGNFLTTSALNVISVSSQSVTRNTLACSKQCKKTQTREKNSCMTTCPSSADFIASSPRFPCSKTISYGLAIRACLGCHQHNDHCSRGACRNNSLADHWFEQELSLCSLTKSGSFFMAVSPKGRMRLGKSSVPNGRQPEHLLYPSSGDLTVTFGRPSTCV
jgi:hypothetical protein